MIPQILCIGQSDSSAGTGIQADIKTCMAFSAYAATVITAVSVQNTQGVFEIHNTPSILVHDQIRVVMEDLRPTIIKTGMLANEETINVVGDFLDGILKSDVKVVIDPVITTRTNRTLLDKLALDALKRRMLIRAHVMTPNISEAIHLTGYKIRDLDDMVHAAEMLMTLGPQCVVLKGGGLGGETVYDVVCDESGTKIFEFPRVHSRATHGAGSTLSSGIAANLAHGYDARTAYARARAFVNQAIDRADLIGQGYGPLNHGYAFESVNLGLVTPVEKAA